MIRVTLKWKEHEIGLELPMTVDFDEDFLMEDMGWDRELAVNFVNKCEIVALDSDIDLTEYYNFWGDDVEYVNYLATELEDWENETPEMLYAAIELKGFAFAIESNPVDYIFMPYIDDYERYGWYYYEEYIMPHLPDYIEGTIRNNLDFEGLGADKMPYDATISDYGYIEYTA